MLQREDTLKEIVRLLGPEALPDEEKLVLEVAHGQDRHFTAELF